MNIDFSKGKGVTGHILSGSSPGNLLRLLADNRFDIDRIFIPKLLQTAGIVALSTPNILLERLLYNKAIRNTEVSSPVFILGYPRSGTTYLMYLLSNDQRFGWCKTYECLGPHVIFTFGKILRQIAIRALPKKRPMDNMALGADLPKEEEFAVGNMGIESMAAALYFPKKFSEYTDRFVLFKHSEQERQNWKNNHHFLLKKLTLVNKGKQLVLKSPFDTGRVREILELYPDAKFIHIYRHPFAVYSSNEKLYEGVIPFNAFHKVGNAEMERHVIYSYKEVYGKYLREKQLIPVNNLVEISYENFIGNEIEVLSEVYSKFNLGGFETIKSILEKTLHHNRHYQTNRYGLSAETEDLIFKEWKFAFDAFGYQKNIS